MLCVLGGRQDKMAEEIRFPELRSYSSVAKKKQKRTPKDLQDTGASFGKAWEECVDKYCLQFIKNPNELLET